MKKAWTSLAALSLGASAPAFADTFYYDFTTTGISPTQSGSFSLAYNAGDYNLSGIDYSIGSTTFDMTNTGSTTLDSGTTFFIGGTLNQIGGVAGGTEDFLLRFAPNGGPGDITGLGFWFASTSSNFAQFDGTVTITPANSVSGVPEPDTWAMMLLGFGAVGFAVRRRKHTELTFRRAG